MEPLLIEARWVVTLDDDIGVIEDGAVLVEGGRVVAVGRKDKLSGSFRGTRHDAGEATVMPGLVNAMNPDEVLDLLAYLRSGVN